MEGYRKVLELATAHEGDLDFEEDPRLLAASGLDAAAREGLG